MVLTEFLRYPTGGIRLLINDAMIYHRSHAILYLCLTCTSNGPGRPVRGDTNVDQAVSIR